MSALAQVLHDIGHTVQGSDITAEVFTEGPLRKKNIKILPFSEDNVVEGFTYIAGNAFKDDHPEIKKAREKGYEVIRYHILLADFMSKYISIAVTIGLTLKDVLKDVNLGLDLQGGFEVLYQVDPLDEGDVIDEKAVTSTASTLE